MKTKYYGTFFLSLLCCFILYFLWQTWTSGHRFLPNHFLTQKEIRILVIGDATSNMGIGTTYPDFLLKKLSQAYPNHHFFIFNEAIGGAHSFLLTQKLPFFLSKYCPHLVLAMTGIDDGKGKMSSEEKRRLTLSQRPRPPCFEYNLYLEKINKMAQSDYITKANIHYEFKNYVEAEKNYKNAFFENSKKGQNLSLQEYSQYVLAHIYLNNLEKAKIETLNLIKSYPASDSLGMIIGEVFRTSRITNPELLLFLISRASKFPMKKSLENFFNLVMLEIYTLDAKYHNAIMAKSIYKKLEKNGGNNDFAKSLVQQISKWKRPEKKVGPIYDPLENEFTQKNLLLLAEQTNKARALFLSIQYPQRSSAILKKLFQKIHQVIVVDNKENFESYVSKNGSRDLFLDYFAGDTGHLDEEGNKLLAESVFQEMSKRKLF